jgi:hypothetical protein
MKNNDTKISETKKKEMSPTHTEAAKRLGAIFLAQIRKENRIEEIK